MSTVYHLLTESEPFSEFNGGAISRWVANVLRFDQEGIVIAPSADDSWSFDASRVRLVPALAQHKAFLAKGGHRLPWVIQLRMLRRILSPALDGLGAGDTLWVHSRPEFAAALQPIVRARGARLYLHLHNSHLVQWSSRITSAVSADCYVFNSRYLEAEALEAFPNLGRTAIVVNGADPVMFHPASEGSLSSTMPTVLFASRLVPDKGVHIFMDAMRKLHTQGIALQGIIVGADGFGDRPTTAYIRNMKETAPPNVRFEPYCAGAELAAKFREADIYCLPAVWQDPFPLTVLEAMASATPVVATNGGGIPEQLAQGGGILVDRGSVDDLANALIDLALSPARRKSIGNDGLRSFRRNFTWKTIHSRYRETLDTTDVYSFPALSEVQGAVTA
jgi:spore coat protein SA